MIGNRNGRGCCGHTICGGGCGYGGLGLKIRSGSRIMMSGGRRIDRRWMSL